MTAPNRAKNTVEDLIPIEEVPKILNMSMRTLRRRIKNGDLPVVRDGKILSVTPDDIRAYVTKRRSS